MPRSTPHGPVPTPIKRELWRCPACGARFVTRNQWHSCCRYDLEKHFAGKAPSVREAFDRLSEIIHAAGPADVVPQKTRVVFLTRMRFVAVMPRARWLDGHLVLSRRVDDPRFQRIVRVGPTTYVHAFRAHDASLFDRTFAALVRESYIRGLQEHADTLPWRLTKRKAR